MRRIQASTGAIAPMHRIAESPPRRTIVVETTGAAGSEAAPASEAESEPTPPPRASISDVFRAYLALTKPRIVELLLITTVPAMFLAARLQYNALPHWLTVVAVVVAGALAAGSANAINCYIDRDIDHLMRRTQRRPIPQHTVQPRNALIFGLIAGTVSVVMIGLASNLLAAALTLGAIVYYDVVYTIWLKRTTAMNTVWGGVCGSAPVLIGWAAVTGTLSLEAWILFAVVFLWQPPHFFALAIKYADDYAAAGIPMLTVVAPMRRVGIESVVYAWLTLAASLALWPLGMTPLYAAVALITGGLFCLEAHKMLQRIRRDQPIKPMRLFHWSTTYLTLLFVAVAVDSFLV